MTLQQFINKYTGKRINFDGAFGAQCVDLYRQYLKEVWNVPQTPGVVGAYQIFDSLPATFDKFTSGQIKPGDVMIWSEKQVKNGHVAIVVDSTPITFRAFQQNAPKSDVNGVTGSPANIATYQYKNLVGWFRPKALTPTPMITHKIIILLSHIEDLPVVQQAVAAVQARVAALGDIRIATGFQVTDFQFHTTNTPGFPTPIYADPAEIGAEGRRAEVDLSMEADAVCLIYDPAFIIGQQPTNPVENPQTIEGFNMFSIPETWYKNVETGEVFLDSLIQYFYHEMLHSWFYIANRENPTIGIVDTVHTYGGVTGPGHPTMGDILDDFDSKALSLKPYWSALDLGSSPTPPAQGDPMLIYKFSDNATQYVLTDDGTLMGITSGVALNKVLDGRPQKLVVLAPSERSKFRIVTAVIS